MPVHSTVEPGKLKDISCHVAGEADYTNGRAQDCAICREDFLPGQELRTHRVCGATLHREPCFDAWFGHSSTELATCAWCRGLIEADYVGIEADVVGSEMLEEGRSGASLTPTNTGTDDVSSETSTAPRVGPLLTLPGLQPPPMTTIMKDVLQQLVLLQCIFMAATVTHWTSLIEKWLIAPFWSFFSVGASRCLAFSFAFSAGQRDI